MLKALFINSTLPGNGIPVYVTDALSHVPEKKRELAGDFHQGRAFPHEATNR
jgi:hypothetical protein